MAERDTTRVEALISRVSPNKERDTYVTRRLSEMVHTADRESLATKPYYEDYLALVKTLVGLQVTSGYASLGTKELSAYTHKVGRRDNIPTERIENIMGIADSVRRDWDIYNLKMQREALRRSGHMYPVMGEAAWSN